MNAYDGVRLVTSRFAAEGAPFGAVGNIIEDFSARDKLVQIWIPEQDVTPLIVVDVSEIEPEPDE